MRKSLTGFPSVFIVVAALHGDEGREVSGVVGEEQRALVTVFGVALEGEVDSAEGDRGQGVAVDVLMEIDLSVQSGTKGLARVGISL